MTIEAGSGPQDARGSTFIVQPDDFAKTYAAVPGNTPLITVFIPV